MSHDTYDDNCRGCKPAVMDMQTGKDLPDDHPYMRVVLGIFESLTLAEKQAWYRFTVHNSRERRDVEIAESFGRKVQEAMVANEAEKQN